MHDHKAKRLHLTIAIYYSYTLSICCALMNNGIAFDQLSTVSPVLPLIQETLTYQESEYASGADDTADGEFRRRALARTIAVPTDDRQVKVRLQALGEPIILFGEDLADRRNRLRYLLSQQQLGGINDVHMQDVSDDGDRPDDEEYYTPGSTQLLEARRQICEYSIPRARARVQRQQQETQVPLSKLIAHRRAQNTRLKQFTSQGSQVAATRPLSIARFSPDSKHMATGSWAGDVRLFTSHDLIEKRKVTGHNDKVSGVAWHPLATISQSPSSCNLVSGGGEGDVCLWSLEGNTALATMKGHGARVAQVGFHPSGQYVGSASHDGTWRLWDVDTTTELLLQEGHSDKVSSIAFQCDGSLVASAGLDAIGRVWDLRSGKTIMVLQGHMQAIHGLDFSGNGFQIASASADATVRVWDIRKVKQIASIPAHKSLVSDVRFFHATIRETPDSGNVDADGTYLVTSGYDGAVNIWNAGDWSLVKSLVGPAENKVMSVDVSGNGLSICSTGYDRTLRLWASD